VQSMYTRAVAGEGRDRELLLVFHARVLDARALTFTAAVCSWRMLPAFLAPHAGSGVVRIDPLRFLAGCHVKLLNQALSVLSLGFLP